MNNKVALHTLGCKLNFSETSTIGNEFLKNGYAVVPFEEKPDVYVFNTCSVTENAERECRQLVRRALRHNPEAFIIVTGCYAQLRPEEISRIEGVDAVLGSNEKFKLFSLLEDFKKKELACIHVSNTEDLNYFGKAHSTDADGRTRAYLKIQDGCDYKCSFCTIPLARGKSRSMAPAGVIEEFRALVLQGYKEIILTGVNVGDYGNAFNMSLYNLLLEMIKVEGDFRIRISSIEPNLLTDEIISLTASEEKMCKHFHIPLQSGSARILRLMQRRYKAEYYYDLIMKLKERIPDVGIGVDVITGFPGETDEDFMDTHDFLSSLPVSYLHAFTYSERPDTKAVTMPGIVDISTRRKRTNILRLLSEKKRHSFYQAMMEKELDVLFEAENNNVEMRGFSSNYVRVSASYDLSLTNTFSTIKINGIKDNCCTGEFTGGKELNKSVDLIAC